MRNIAVTQLSPEDRQLLGLIREGRFDAEIAVRLGIPTSKVKERVEGLITQAGAFGRSELREAELIEERVVVMPAPETVSEPVVAGWRSRTSGILAGVVLGAIAAWIVSVAGTREVTRYEPPGIPEPGAPQSGLSDATVRTVLRPGGEMFDAGFAFTSGAHAVRPWAVELRGEVADIRLPDAARFQFQHEESALTWSPRSRRVFPATETFVSNTGLVLHLMAADGETGFVTGGSDSLTVHAKGAKGPRVLMWVEGRSLEVTSEGRLFISAETFSEDAVVAYDTGETLDVSAAMQIGLGGSGWNGTFCGDAATHAACYVISRPGPQLIPMGARMQCKDGVLELANEDFRLAFHRLDPGGPDWPGCDDAASTPVAVKGSEPLFPERHYRIVAWDAQDHPLSVVAGLDGRLYVGPVGREFACPCRQGT